MSASNLNYYLTIFFYIVFFVLAILAVWDINKLGDVLFGWTFVSQDMPEIPPRQPRPSYAPLSWYSPRKYYRKLSGWISYIFSGKSNNVLVNKTSLSQASFESPQRVQRLIGYDRRREDQYRRNHRFDTPEFKIFSDEPIQEEVGIPVEIPVEIVMRKTNQDMGPPPLPITSFAYLADLLNRCRPFSDESESESEFDIDQETEVYVEDSEAYWNRDSEAYWDCRSRQIVKPPSLQRFKSECNIESGYTKRMAPNPSTLNFLQQQSDIYKTTWKWRLAQLSFQRDMSNSFY